MKKLVLFLSFILVILFNVNIVETYAVDDISHIETNVSTRVVIPAYSKGIYDFSIENPGKVTVQLTDVQWLQRVGMILKLYQINDEGDEILINWGNPVLSENPLTYTTPSVRLSIGNYVLKCSGCSGAARATIDLLVKYERESSVSFEVEENNSFATANQINLNKEYTGNTQDRDDVDYYKINMPQNGTLCLNLRNKIAQDTNKIKWHITLYSENENKNRFIINSWDNLNNRNSKFTKYRLPKGIYYIKVESISHNGGSGYINEDYQIGTTYQEETKESSEMEYNNTIETANSIKTNTEYKGNIPMADDVDYFKFTLKKSAKLVLSLRQEQENVSDNLYSVTLYRNNDDNSLIMYNRFYSVENTVSLGNEITVPQGNYIIVIKNNNKFPEDINDYILKIDETTLDREVDVVDIPKEAEGIPIGLNTYVLADPSIEERYCFTIASSGKMQINMDNWKNLWNVNDYVNIDIYKINENGDEVLQNVNTKNRYMKNGVYLSDWINVEKGEYIIRYKGVGAPSNTKKTGYMTVKYEKNPDISQANVLGTTDQVYTGNSIYLHPIVTYEGRELVENVDYKLSYKDNINAGIATVTIESISGKSIGNKTITFKINKREVAIPIAKQTEFKYNGIMQTLEIINGSKYIISQNDSQKSVGNYKAIYSIDENNCKWSNNHIGDVIIEWEIKQVDYRPIGDNSNNSKVDNGFSSVNRSKNKQQTKAASLKTKIIKIKNIKGRKVKISWKKIKNVTGYQIVYGTNKKCSKNKKTIKTSSSVTTKTIKKLIKKKVYYFKVRTYSYINGKLIYGKWSKVKKVKIKK